MEKMKSIYCLLLSLCLIGCETTASSDKILVYSPFPIEPEWVLYTRKPVINSYTSDNGDENYVISDELMKKTLQMSDYLEKINNWKTENSIP